MSEEHLKSKAEVEEVLGVFQSRVRREILRALLELEFRSLSEIGSILEGRGWKMTLSGVLKHMKELEKAGLVRHEPGIFADVPDARKTIYFLEGRERIERVLGHLESDFLEPLEAGLIFYETGEVARQVQGMRQEPLKERKQQLESLLAECESEKVYRHLTEDEKKKLKLWRMMLSIM
jgi:DNA-binding transcriptional ArsR family regulator